ncbi:hypothetical protein TNCV_5012481 [Trichonephila clavipes]|nr:hypothetical protein TNCV_5012481 [Trichonephila clavipes]
MDTTILGGLTVDRLYPMSKQWPRKVEIFRHEDGLSLSYLSIKTQMYPIRLSSSEISGVIGNDSLSPENHEWDVCYAVPYRNMSPEVNVLKHLDLDCVVPLAEPLSGDGFALLSRTLFSVFFV